MSFASSRLSRRRLLGATLSVGAWLAACTAPSTTTPLPTPLPIAATPTLGAPTPPATVSATAAPSPTPPPLVAAAPTLAAAVPSPPVNPPTATTAPLTSSAASTLTPIPPTATPAAASPAPPTREAQATATTPPVVATLPPTPTIASGPPRIALQAGHWRSHELPEELARLRGASGGSGGGRQEWELNLAIAERVAERLRAQGYLVDILPATVPPGYQGDLFLAIHADANVSPAPRGFKIARGRWSRLPQTDDALVETLRQEYGRTTGLPWDDSITRNMTGYYAFNNRRRDHAIHQTTPGAILEMGFLTNGADRYVLFEQVDLVILGIERGIVRFIEQRPPPHLRERLSTVATAMIVGPNGAIARATPNLNGAIMDRLPAGFRQEAPELRGDWLGIWVVSQNGPGWVHRSEIELAQVSLP